MLREATADIVAGLKLCPGNVFCQLFLLNKVCGGDESRLLDVIEEWGVQPFPLDLERAVADAQPPPVRDPGHTRVPNGGSGSGTGSVDVGTATYKPFRVRIPSHHVKRYSCRSPSRNDQDDQDGQVIHRGRVVRTPRAASNASKPEPEAVDDDAGWETEEEITEAV